MEHLRIIPDLTQQGLRDGEHMVGAHDGEVVIGGMPDGTESGKPTVMIAFDLGDREFLVAETTLSLFLTAADGLKAKYGDPREE